MKNIKNKIMKGYEHVFKKGAVVLRILSCRKSNQQLFIFRPPIVNQGQEKSHV